MLLGGLGARLERALINFMADTHTSRGYKEWWCPAMANATTLTGTGQLPKFEDDLFKTREGMYLIPTAEVQLTNIHSGEVLEASELPLKYCAFTPCFREEAGSAGRDTRAALSACTSSTRWKWLNTQSPKKATTIWSPWLLMPRTFCSFWSALSRNQPLHRRHRVLCRQDPRPGSLVAFLQRLQGNFLLLQLRGFPGTSRQHQVSRPRKLQGFAPCSTLNGSGLAVGRTMAAVIENYQQADGSIKVPDVLVPYMGGIEVIR